ncbi:MAG TPA: isoprenylcysteine carboxylmethyltransferase family protein [Vicinamibacterales bacterium]|nr:isoprenylcysteine carboxylmethyltransferase family protein [Vicinamibacterales bacterium]
MPKRLLADAVPVRTFGGALLVAGLALSALVVRHFRRAGTPVSPRHASRRLVVSGPYRYSRNPDYVGQALVVVGLGLLFDTPWVLVATVPALLVVRYSVVAREEEYLHGRFGEEYTQYRRRVRRWL